MAKWADFCISKLSLNADGLIETVLLCSDNGESLENEQEQNREWLVKHIEAGKTFCSITKNKKGSYNKLGDMSYDGNIFSWHGDLPKNLPNRKAFVSYYHKDDQEYRKTFDFLFDDLIISKSVELGDIDSTNSAGYTKMLIQNEYLSDTTVLIVLIGKKTKCRMHVDWEISGALDFKVGDKYSGLLGVFLPTHPNYGSDKYSKTSIPERLQANVNSGYAILCDWTEDRKKMQEYIEQAIANRVHDDKIENRSIPQMTKDDCE